MMVKRRKITQSEIEELLHGRHSEYWAERFILLERELNNQTIRLSTNMKQQYEIAMNGIDKDVARWYARFAENEEISLAQAKRMLKSSEMREWKMDVWEYIKKGKTLNYTDHWSKVLESASARAHISRLEALKLQMQQQVEVAHAYERQWIKNAAEGIYTGSYYKTAYTVQKGLGRAWDLAGVDTNRMAKVLATPWAPDGRVFSSRIWGNKQKLVRELNTVLSQGVIRGQSYKQMAEDLAKRMSVAVSRCETLIITESAFFSDAAQQDCFKELGVERYEIVATLDHKTSYICRSLDGKVFKMSEWQTGLTAPPFHCRCRTTRCPYFDDFKVIDSKRAARGEDGKTYYVPADTTYPEWKKAFASGEDSGNKEWFTLMSAPLTSEIKAKLDNRGIIKQLPKADQAVIPETKFTEYALNPEKQPDKAKAFELALGYTKENYMDLIQNIRNNLNNFDAILKTDNGFGDRYEVAMLLKGPNGKTAKVLTAWIDDVKNKEMRLISAYIDK